MLVAPAMLIHVLKVKMYPCRRPSSASLRGKGWEEPVWRSNQLTYCKMKYALYNQGCAADLVAVMSGERPSLFTGSFNPYLDSSQI
ncbi:hypothetical protein SLE2022_136820 [Rubroshorea leprosula]